MGELGMTNIFTAHVTILSTARYRWKHCHVKDEVVYTSRTANINFVSI
jgi:hypothetical protein